MTHLVIFMSNRCKKSVYGLQKRKQVIKGGLTFYRANQQLNFLSSEAVEINAGHKLISGAE